MAYFWGYLTNLANQCVLTGAAVTANSEAAGYPVSNLLEGKPYRSTGVASEWIEYDFGSAKSINAAVLRGHNLSSAAVITIEGGAAADPSTFSQTISYREWDAFCLFAASQSYRYWRFTITDPTNTYGFIKLEPPMLGTYVNPAYHFQWGRRLTPVFITRRIESAYLIPHVEQVGRSLRQSLIFDGLSDAQADSLMDLYASLGKDVTPFFFIPRVAEQKGYFGRFGQMEMTVGPGNTITVPFIEEGRGNLVAL